MASLTRYSGLGITPSKSRDMPFGTMRQRAEIEATPSFLRALFRASFLGLAASVLVRDATAVELDDLQQEAIEDWPVSPGMATMLTSMSVLEHVWGGPEEDEAWRDL